ncbi:V/A-type H+-transporting ATPase subunit E [Labrenzia sp. EL_195]|nr:V/A-type H+-transporting ATPase subunit E [Labrenzia sp. EL_195]
MSKNSGSTDLENAAGAGVQALIDRLKSEGVSAGQSEGDEILAKAKTRAEAIVSEAQKKADALLAEARAEAAREKAATEDGLKVAARDLVLSLRNELGDRIQQEAGRLVGTTLGDEQFLQKLILAMAGNAKENASVSNTEPMEIVLPEKVVTFEELKQSPEAVEPGTLTHFVIALAGEALRGGVTFSTAPGFAGIKVKLTDRDVSIDLTEESVATLLKRHLQPRLRAVMEGVLR